MPNTARDLALQAKELLSLSDVAMRVDKMVGDGLSSAEDIGNVIEQDPALTATLLRTANSALFGGRTAVDCVPKAVVLAGAERVRELTMGVSVAQSFDGMPNSLFSLENFWRHSVRCAVAAKLLGKKTGKKDAPSAFTAGLLHDIGQLVMFSEIPDTSSRALTLCRDRYDGDNLHLAERELLGFDHMDVGRELAILWNFPETLVNGIARHHCPFDYEDVSVTDVIVHVADGIAGLVELGEPFDDALIDSRSWDLLGVDRSVIDSLVPDVESEAESLLGAFTGSPS
jgi:putative nucleotidyltransferase with HDIG domain